MEHFEGYVDNLPFENNEFDAVSCLEVLEHLSDATYTNALNEISRVARRYILITVPYNEYVQRVEVKCTKCGSLFNCNGHLHKFTKNKVLHLFEDLGFSCREVFYISPSKTIPYSIYMIIKLISKLKRILLRKKYLLMPNYTACPF